MAGERKRDKLERFTDFQHRGAEDAVPVTEDALTAMRSVGFVAPRDADTVTPPGAIHRPFAAPAHPLTRAKFDAMDDPRCRA